MSYHLFPLEAYQGKLNLSTFINQKDPEVIPVEEFAKAYPAESTIILDFEGVKKYVKDVIEKAGSDKELIEKANKDFSKLVKKQVQGKDGKTHTVWVKQGEEPKKEKKEGKHEELKKRYKQLTRWVERGETLMKEEEQELEELKKKFEEPKKEKKEGKGDDKSIKQTQQKKLKEPMFEVGNSVRFFFDEKERTGEISKVSISEDGKIVYRIKDGKGNEFGGISAENVGFKKAIDNNIQKSFDSLTYNNQFEKTGKEIKEKLTIFKTLVEAKMKTQTDRIEAIIKEVGEDPTMKNDYYFGGDEAISCPYKRYEYDKCYYNEKNIGNSEVTYKTTEGEGKSSPSKEKAELCQEHNDLVWKYCHCLEDLMQVKTLSNVLEDKTKYKLSLRDLTKLGF